MTFTAFAVVFAVVVLSVKALHGGADTTADQASKSPSTSGASNQSSVTDTAEPATSIPNGMPTTTEKPHATNITSNQQCLARSTPFPMPEVVGLNFDDVSFGALSCFQTISATRPDGVDVENQPAGSGAIYRVVGESPPAGTLLDINSAVALQVVQLTPSETISQNRKPCSWVTEPEAAAILGDPVKATVLEDYPGSIKFSCTYASDATQVISELQLPGSFNIDAASDFDAAKSDGDVPVNLGDSGFCKRSGALFILLGDRLFSVTAFGALTCDEAEKFAATAIPRLQP